MNFVEGYCTSTIKSPDTRLSPRKNDLYMYKVITETVLIVRGH